MLKQWPISWHGPDLGVHDPSHAHVHEHAHVHTHESAEHSHPHGETPHKVNLTPWILFTIFVFGGVTAQYVLGLLLALLVMVLFSVWATFTASSTLFM